MKINILIILKTYNFTGVFMKKYRTVLEYVICFSAITVIVTAVLTPSVCLSGAKNGLNVCAQVLIPSLFPVAIPVLFLINTSAFKKIKRKSMFR